MTIDELKNQLPDYAKDIKLNLGNILTDTGSPGLTQNQIIGIALASAYAAKNNDVTNSILQQANEQLSAEEIHAIKAAVAIMAMNNVYYRFLHLVDDPSFSKLPANLRMNVIANPGSDKTNFELNCLAVSAINGCGKCMSSHTAQLEKAGVTKQGIQSAIRIASVINATAMARDMGM